MGKPKQRLICAKVQEGDTKWQLVQGDIKWFQEHGKPEDSMENLETKAAQWANDLAKQYCEGTRTYEEVTENKEHIKAKHKAAADGAAPETSNEDKRQGAKDIKALPKPKAKNAPKVKGIEKIQKPPKGITDAPEEPPPATPPSTHRGQRAPDPMRTSIEPPPMSDDE